MTSPSDRGRATVAVQDAIVRQLAETNLMTRQLIRSRTTHEYISRFKGATVFNGTTSIFWTYLSPEVSSSLPHVRLQEVSFDPRPLQAMSARPWASTRLLGARPKDSLPQDQVPTSASPEIRTRHSNQDLGHFKAGKLKHHGTRSEGQF